MPCWLARATTPPPVWHHSFGSGFGGVMPTPSGVLPTPIANALADAMSPSQLALFTNSDVHAMLDLQTSGMASPVGASLADLKAGVV